VKLLLENWRKFLINEQKSLWGYDMQPEQKIFVFKAPFTTFHNKQQRIPQTVFQKPAGMWYGCGDSWIDWLEREMPHWLEASNYLYEIELGEGILKISTDEEFTQFEKEFLNIKTMFGGHAVNWPEVAKKYNGIEICPYNYNRRFKSNWYYGWDVASGCIWNKKGVTIINLLSERPTD